MIYSIDLGEATLNAKMLGRSAERFILVDASKFGSTATYAVAPIASATRVIADTAVMPDWRQRLINLGINLTIVNNARETARGR